MAYFIKNWWNGGNNEDDVKENEDKNNFQQQQQQKENQAMQKDQQPINKKRQQDQYRFQNSKLYQIEENYLKEKGDNIKVIIIDFQTQNDGILTETQFFTIQTKKDDKEIMFQVQRRFSDFQWLQKQLKFQYPGILIYPLPEKGWYFKINTAITQQFNNQFDKLKEIELGKRKMKLQHFLNNLLDNEVFMNSYELHIFLSKQQVVFQQNQEIEEINYKKCTTFNEGLVQQTYNLLQQTVSSGVSGVQSLLGYITGNNNTVQQYDQRIYNEDDNEILQLKDNFARLLQKYVQIQELVHIQITNNKQRIENLKDCQQSMTQKNGENSNQNKDLQDEINNFYSQMQPFAKIFSEIQEYQENEYTSQLEKLEQKLMDNIYLIMDCIENFNDRMARADQVFKFQNQIKERENQQEKKQEIEEIKIIMKNLEKLNAQFKINYDRQSEQFDEMLLQNLKEFQKEFDQLQKQYSQNEIMDQQQNQQNSSPTSPQKRKNGQLLQIKQQFEKVLNQVKQIDQDRISNEQNLQMKFLLALLNNKESGKIEKDYKKSFGNEKADMDLNQLKNLSTSSKFKKFIDISNEILDYLKSQNIQEGQIKARSKTLKIGRDRIATLDLSEKTLKIKSKKSIKYLDLKTYYVKYYGQKDKLYVFQLISLSKLNKYKDYWLGDDEFQNANYWFESINNVSVQVTIDQDTHNSYLLNSSNVSKQKDPSKIFYSQEDEQKQQDPEDNYRLKEGVQQSKSWSKNYAQEVYTDIAKQQIVKSSDGITSEKSQQQQNNSNSNSNNQQVQENVQVQLKQITLSPQKINNNNNNIDKSNNVLKVQDQQQLQQKQMGHSPKNDTQNTNTQLNQQNNNINNIDQQINQNSNTNISNNNNQTQFKQQQQEIKIQKQNQVQKPQEHQQPKILTKIMKTKTIFKEYNLPHIFQELNQPKNIEQLCSEINFKIIESTDRVRIFQHNNDVCRFKVIMNIKDTTQRVFLSLCNMDIFKQWNSYIQDGKLLSFMRSENTAVMYQHNKSYGTFYKSRYYTFLRYVYPSQGKLFLLDKSIDYQIEDGYTQQRGEINGSITCVYQHPQSPTETLVYTDINISNGGSCNKDQDAQITMQYLYGYKDLPRFLQNNSEIDMNLTFEIQESYDINIEELQYLNDSGSDQNLQQINEQQNEDDEDDLKSFAFDNINNANKNQNKEEEKQIENEKIQQNFQQFQKIDNNLQQIENQQQQIYNQNNDKNTINDQNGSQNQISDNNNNNNNEEQKTDFDDEQFDKDMQRFSQNTALIQSSIRLPPKNMNNDEIFELFDIVNKEKHHSIILHNKNKFLIAPDKNYPKESENFIKEGPDGGHYIFFNDWERDQKNGIMKFVNKEKTNAQKRVIKFLLGKMGSNLLKGKSLLSISLPIDIFENRSNTERYAYSFAFGPTYLEEAAKSNEALFQMKKSVVFLITCSLLFLNMEKPFNPILGETFQGFIKGSPIYVEQISHHPPIAAYQLYGRGYTYEGFLETVAKMNLNSVEGHNFGDQKITFHNTKNVVTISTPVGTLEGTTYGDRVFNFQGRAFAHDLKNNLFCEIKFNPDKQSFFGKQKTPQDYFKGGFYKVTNAFKTKFQQKYLKSNLPKFEGLNLQKDVEQELGKIDGVWNQYINIDDKCEWHFENGPFPHTLDYEKYPLASDCTFRQDILMWKTKDIKKAQEWKEILEEKQRGDRKLREKHLKK